MASEEVAKAFEDMAAKFGIDAKIIDWILDPAGLGAKTMMDFLYCVKDAPEISELMTTIMTAKGIDAGESGRRLADFGRLGRS